MTSTLRPSTNDDDDSDDDDGDEIDLRGGPEVVDEYLAEKEIKTFKSKEKRSTEVEKINHALGVGSTKRRTSSRTR